MSFLLERTGHVVNCIQETLSGGNEPTDIDSTIGYEFTPTPFSYTEKDVILYALGSEFNLYGWKDEWMELILSVFISWCYCLRERYFRT